MSPRFSPRFLIIAAVLFAAGVVLFTTRHATTPPPTEIQPPEPFVVEDVAPEPVAQPVLPPPEKPFPLPEGAEEIDEYAYVNDGGVFFKSLTGKSALKVSDARAESFARLTDFMTFSTHETTQQCGGSAQYAYYGDGSRVYFYQVWRTSTFRATKIEGLPDMDASTFSVSTTGVASDGESSLQISHTVIENGTCRLLVEEI